MADLSLYAHFPWCVKKCPYCDFNSHPLTGNLDENAYLEALSTDLDATRHVLEGRVVDSVFLGGGTPSLFTPGAMARLIGMLGETLSDGAEVTMEANPGTTEHHDFHAYRAAGINRLSIGAQSFDPLQLQRLGRIHGVEDVTRAVRAAQQGGFDNLNIDLMYGLPGQDPDGALDDLQRAIELAPNHLSWYQLTIEPKTEFARRPPVLPDEDALAAIEEAGRERLARHGFERYEVSAYARDNARCRHNLNYWTFGDYVGIGAGAHGKVTTGKRVIRTHKPRQPRLYLRDPAHTIEQTIDPGVLAGEFMLNALRLVDGVARETFQQRTGLPWSSVAATWAVTTDRGLTERDRIAATPLGLQHLDTLVQYFL